jgi:hypothetical protein
MLKLARSLAMPGTRASIASRYYHLAGSTWTVGKVAFKGEPPLPEISNALSLERQGKRYGME